MQGLASVVLSLHQQLDAAVAYAYAWPPPCPTPRFLRAWCASTTSVPARKPAATCATCAPPTRPPKPSRPNFLCPPQQPFQPPVGLPSQRRESPPSLAQQMQALRDALQQAAQPLTAAQVAAGFKRVKTNKVEPLLQILGALSLLRNTPEGAYAT